VRVCAGVGTGRNHGNQIFGGNRKFGSLPVSPKYIVTPPKFFYGTVFKFYYRVYIRRSRAKVINRIGFNIFSYIFPYTLLKVLSLENL
jgi:hypothetical protein